MVPSGAISVCHFETFGFWCPLTAIEKSGLRAWRRFALSRPFPSALPRSVAYPKRSIQTGTSLRIWNRLSSIALGKCSSMDMDAVGRLQPGVTMAQAASDMNGVTAHLAQVYPDVGKNSGIISPS
jgi:hypothetical protein